MDDSRARRAVPDRVAVRTALFDDAPGVVDVDRNSLVDVDTPVECRMVRLDPAVDDRDSDASAGGTTPCPRRSDRVE